MNHELERRFIVSHDAAGVACLTEITGHQEVAVKIGVDSPIAGFTLEQIERNLNEGAYGSETGNLKDQIAQARQGKTFYELD